MSLYLIPFHKVQLLFATRGFLKTHFKNLCNAILLPSPRTPKVKKTHKTNFGEDMGWYALSYIAGEVEIGATALENYLAVCTIDEHRYILFF